MKHSREWLLFMAGLITCFGCILLWTGFAMIPVPHQIGPNMQGFEPAVQNREKVTQSKVNIKLTNEVLSKTRLAVERDADLIKTKHRTYNSRMNSLSKGNRSSHKKANSYQNASKFYNNVKKNTGTKNATNRVLSAKISSKMVFNASKKLICMILVWMDNEKRMDEEWPAEGLELPGKCQITYRHKALHTADIVVIHQRNLNGTFPWKHTRYDHQIFVWWSDQNPWYIKYISNQNLTEYNNFFNWTMTYRRDSDVYFPLWRKSSLYSNLVGGRDDVRNVIDKKTKSAVWILNNCKQSIANKQRMRLAVQLVQGKLRVDFIGNCFFYKNKRLERGEIFKYRFYLSFDDSFNCADYINHEFWLSLRSGIVPVVFGPSLEDVVNVAPYNSFIHVSQFASHEQLARHLLHLENNVTAYRQYFRWRQLHSLDIDDEMIKLKYPKVRLVPHDTASGWSRLCEKFRVTETKQQSFVVRSLAEFVFESENADCMKTKNKKPNE